MNRLSLYVIVNASTPLDLTESLLRAGVGTIQLREKQLPASDQIPIAKKLQSLCKANNALFIVNDLVDVALAVDADGVHVGQRDDDAQRVRRRIGPEKILGVSTGSPDEARQAEIDGADYVGVGPIYATRSKKARVPAGPGLIHDVAKKTTLPIVGIAGIDLSKAAPVIRAGAVGVAVISAVLDAPDPVQAAIRLGEEIRQAQGDEPLRPFPTRD